MLLSFYNRHSVCDDVCAIQAGGCMKSNRRIKISLNIRLAKERDDDVCNEDTKKLIGGGVRYRFLCWEPGTFAWRRKKQSLLKGRCHTSSHRLPLVHHLAVRKLNENYKEHHNSEDISRKEAAFYRRTYCVIREAHARRKLASHSAGTIHGSTPNVEALERCSRKETEQQRGHSECPT